MRTAGSEEDRDQRYRGRSPDHRQTMTGHLHICGTVLRLPLVHSLLRSSPLPIRAHLGTACNARKTVRRIGYSPVMVVAAGPVVFPALPSRGRYLARGGSPSRPQPVELHDCMCGEHIP